MIEHTIELLKGAATAGQPVQLHELLRAVDAKFHAILTVEELTKALRSAPRFQINRDADQVSLVPDSDSEFESLTDDDIASAMVVNRATMSSSNRGQ
jgi:hypothetical protein